MRENSLTFLKFVLTSCIIRQDELRYQLNNLIPIKKVRGWVGP